MTTAEATSATPPAPALVEERVIEAPKGLSFPDVAEAWEHRDLLYFLVRRDVAIRYKQTSIGAVWAVLQPILLAVVFSVFLGHYAKVPSGAGVPYPVFALTGMVMWLYFAQAMAQAADSTVQSRELIAKVWFPRIIIPIAAVIPPAVDFLPAFAISVIVMLAYGVVPNAQILLFPLLVLLTLTTALGLGLWLSALNVRYRDVRLVVPFLIQVGLFVTPIVYPFDLVPKAVQPIYAINPMVGVLEAFRWMLFPDAQWPGALILIPIAMSIVLLVTGALYFNRAERDFADVI